MNILEELIGPNDVPYFFENHFKKLPFSKPLAAKKYAALGRWHKIESLLSKHNNSWLPQKGILPREENLKTGKLTLEQATRSFNSGRTILIRHAEQACDDINQLAMSFKELFKAPVDVQVYVTPEKNEGFDWHYDVEDVFVIQCQGQKEFSLRKNTVTKKPLSLQPNMTFESFRNETSPEVRCLLQAGDILYIPAGFWHKAYAVTDSFHISVGVML